MTRQPGPPSPPSRRRRPVRRRVASTSGALGICLLLLTSLLPASGSSTVGHSVAPRSSESDAGAPLLASAASALAAGSGPAHGAPVSCRAVAGPMDRCAPTAAGQTTAFTPPSWRNRTNTSLPSPGPRVGYGMVYDPGDGYVVLVDGGNNTVANATNFGTSDTWAYANGSWTELNVSGPPARGLMSMTYDAKDGYVLLFGGSPGWWGVGNAYNDTWSFSRGHWTDQNLTHAPSPRRGAAMAYDARDGYVVLFGGLSIATGLYQDLSDTWKYVGGRWSDLTLRQTVSPMLRDGAQMTYDPADRCVLMFGGYQWPYYINGFAGAAYNDTWCFSNGAWSVLNPASSPPPLFWTSMTFDVAQDRVVLFGGFPPGANATSSDTWVFSNGNWTSVTQSTPAPVDRVFAQVVWDGADRYDLLYGGLNGSQLGYAGAIARDDAWVYAANLSALLVVTPSTLYRGQTLLVVGAATSYGSSLTGMTLSGLPTNCTVVSSSEASCTPTADGTYDVAFLVNDSAGDSVSASTVVQVGEPPHILSFALVPSAISLGRPVAVVVGLNPGTLSVGFNFSGLPSGCSTHNASNWSCTPRVTGTFQVNVTATDVLRSSARATANLTVNADPSALALTATPATVDLGQAFTLNASLSGGTAPIAYTYSGLPPGCAAVATAQVTCRANASGEFVVGVGVVDASNYSLNQTTLVTVNPDPTIASFSLSASAIDLGLPVQAELNISGGTGPINVTYTGLPPGCAPLNVTTFDCTPTSVGTFPIGATITDRLGVSANASAALVVNTKPALVAFTATPSALDLGQSVSLDTVVNGGTGGLSFVYSGVPAAWCPGSGPNVVCTPDTTGSFTIRLTATDAIGETVVASVSLVVNADPSISAFAATPPSVLLGETVNLTVSASGGTGALAYAYASLPVGCTSANRSVVSCTPSATGGYSVAVTVTDAVGKSDTSITTFTVEGAATPPPVSLAGPGSWALLGVAALGIAVAAAAGVAVWRRRRWVGPEDSETTEDLPPEPPSE